ncbi:MAG: hypothetical protein LBJ69_00180 [Holosporales bacterium]|jgi:hypothetical protein|nr:hypothetical protein [Holosporales bacterium]
MNAIKHAMHVCIAIAVAQFTAAGMRPSWILISPPVRAFDALASTPPGVAPPARVLHGQVPDPIIQRTIAAVEEKLRELGVDSETMQDARIAASRKISLGKICPALNGISVSGFDANEGRDLGIEKIRLEAVKRDELDLEKQARPPKGARGLEADDLALDSIPADRQALIALTEAVEVTEYKYYSLMLLIGSPRAIAFQLEDQADYKVHCSRVIITSCDVSRPEPVIVAIVDRHTIGENQYYIWVDGDWVEDTQRRVWRLQQEGRPLSPLANWLAV